jgi:hypothetical protein
MGETLDPWRGYPELSISHQQIAWITHRTSEAIFCIQDMKIQALENRALFDQLYDENVSNGSWRARWDFEKNQLFETYRVLQSQNTLLWGYSLRDFSLWQKEGKIVECLWVQYAWKWLGKHIVESIFSDLENWQTLFAYSAQREFFTKCWFKLFHWILSMSGNPLFIRQKD